MIANKYLCVWMSLAFVFGCSFDPPHARWQAPTIGLDGGNSDSSSSDGSAWDIPARPDDGPVSDNGHPDLTGDMFTGPDQIPTPPDGCRTDPGVANHPFGAHSIAYAEGSILPAVSHGVLDDAVRGFYDAWKAEYLHRGCGEGRAYVATGFDQSITVSEAHGYGLIILALMAGHDGDAQADFDAMIRFFWDHPSVGSQGLMAWSQDGNCLTNRGGSSATDGDLDIAYGLLLADKQWGSDGEFDYFGQAQHVLAAIVDREVDESKSYLLLGDWVDRHGAYNDATRSSDFMPAHFSSFHDADGAGPWRQIQDRSYRTMQAVQSSTGLFPDFILSPTENPYAAGPYFLEGPYDGEYSYNACRVPFRTAVHFLTSGDDRGREIARRTASWSERATGGDPSALTAGYWLDGDSLPGSNYSSMAFIGPMGVAAMVDPAYQDWLDSLWNQMASTPLQKVYFDDTLKLLSMIVMSGNWWSPERAPCLD
jgi:endoglucanase